MAVKVLRFAGFQRRVRHLDRATAFYCRGLGFQDVGNGHLTLGNEAIELIEDPELPVDNIAAYAQGHMDTGFQHLAIVASDMALAYARLQAFKPQALSHGGPVRLPESAGDVTAFKFLDPDGRPLELIAFPNGSGDARWQRAGGLTLGIDHSAIVVTDVARSTSFYRDQLGFEFLAKQRNRGPTQACLDGLDGAVVDVVALRPSLAPTPHLELLGYVVPLPCAGRTGDTLLWQAMIDDGEIQREICDPDGHRHLLRI